MSYGVRLRNWTGRGPRSGGVQARAVKGNRCKLDEIDALGMFHLANPDAVSFKMSPVQTKEEIFGTDSESDSES